MSHAASHMQLAISLIESAALTPGTLPGPGVRSSSSFVVEGLQATAAITATLVLLLVIRLWSCSGCQRPWRAGTALACRSKNRVVHALTV